VGVEETARLKLKASGRGTDSGGNLLVVQDGQVGQLGVGNRDNDVVPGEELRSRKCDTNLLILLLLDSDLRLKTVVMQTHTLDSHKILAGGNSGNVDAVLLVGGIDLVDHAGARVVEAVENNQYGIRMVLGIDVCELESNGAGIHDFSRGGGSGSGLRGGLAVMVVRK